MFVENFFANDSQMARALLPEGTLRLTRVPQYGVDQCFFFPEKKKSSPRENFQDFARENLQVPEKKS